MIQVHDFRLTDGDERCSIVTGGADGPIIQVGNINLTMDQFRELIMRVEEFDFDQTEE
jgi:hypothetical protein